MRTDSFSWSFLIGGLAGIFLLNEASAAKHLPTEEVARLGWKRPPGIEVDAQVIPLYKKKVFLKCGPEEEAKVWVGLALKQGKLWGLSWKNKNDTFQFPSKKNIPVERYGVWLTQPTQKVNLVLVAPKGEIHSSEVVFKVNPEIFDNAKSICHGGDPVAAKPKRWGFSAGLGTTSMSYSQTGVSDYTQFSMTGKATAKFNWNEKWELSGNIFGTILPFSTSLEGASARFFGLNARVGRKIPLGASPWLLTLNGGLYYNMMLGSGLEFGYSNVAGPQIFPSIARPIGKDQSVYAYAKFSPVSDRFGFLTLASRELAFGAGWTFVKWKEFPFTLGVDYADLAIQSVDDKSLSSKTISIGISIGF